MIRIATRVLIGCAALLAVTAIAIALLAVGRGRTPPILGGDGRPLSGSVAVLEQVRIGRCEPWVLIRGQDRHRPVLLFLHGGPGMPAMFLAHAWQRELERDFVVVHWDRCGTGKSFGGGPPGERPSVRGTLDDLYALAGLLRDRFGQERIILLGHSWGTYLGLLAVRERPELFRALVATGVMAGTTDEVRSARRAFVSREARARGDAVVARLAAGGEVTEEDRFRYGGELHAARGMWPILREGLLAPEYTLRDVWNLKRGVDRVNRDMQYDVEPRPHEGEVTAVAVPVLFVLGRHDANEPSQLGAAYLDRLRAPLKSVAWLERSAHFPFFEEPDRFRDALVRFDAAVERYWRERR